MKDKILFNGKWWLICLVMAAIGSLTPSGRADEVIGQVRVQVLSPTLVRIELEGPKGFEDRPTFHITGRNWPGAAVTRSSSGGFEWIRTADFTVKVPSNAQSLDGIVITDSNDTVIWSMPSSTGVTLKCRWTEHGEAYLFDNGDQLGYGAEPEDDRYYWFLESAEGYTQIRNKATGDYIHLENNLSYVECTPVQSHWHSKDWTLQDAGQGYKRLLCRWSGAPDYIHIENLRGYAEHAPAGTDNGDSTIDKWWSAMWLVQGESSAFFSNNRCWMPHPSEQTQAWAIVDTPRYVPALPDEPWGGGYNVAPAGTLNNGWELENDSHDVYVFLPKGDGRQLRRDFLALTGRTDMIPLKAFGAWDSRWYPYTHQEALAKIETYRSKTIPLDMFVVDTDWRIGASHGYAVNTELFEDMPQFLRDAHAKNVWVMFNDHPEPQGKALEYVEVKYRNDGLRSLFNMGLDTWWYDRNWHTAIIPPDSLNKEVFGMYIYRWITQDYYPNRRPLIMANVDGIDNGYLNRPPDIAAHRYSIQWTGDTTCDDASLQREVRNAVYNGVFQPFAYTSTDLGGHMGTPTTEQYCRWVQFGALSPIFRLHCTAGITRDPWAFDDPAEEVVREYLRMRMRLLPVFYAAARDNYDTGEPILKRCDLNYPGYAEAESNYQYLLGDDILAAPVLSSSKQAVPADWLTDGTGAAGIKGRYYANPTLSGSPERVRTDAVVDFNWAADSPAEGLPADGFSVRWSGTITIQAGYDVRLGLTSDDGCRLWVNDELVIDKWIDQPETTYWTSTAYQNGQTYAIQIEYYEASGQAVCRLVYENAEDPGVQRQLWIPPGRWTNVWTGEVISGPQLYTASVSLTQMPMFVKEGTIIPLAPDMAYTHEKPWNPITLDIYPGPTGTVTAVLYEDDGVSNDYQSGKYRKTMLQAAANDVAKTLLITLHPAEGEFPNAMADRAWTVRLRTPAGWPATPHRVTVDGVPTAFETIRRDQNAMPFAVNGTSPDADLIEIRIPSAPVKQTRTIAVAYYSPADFNQDNAVDLADLRVLIKTWLKYPGEPAYDPRANLDKASDGLINLWDSAVLFREWTG